MKVFTASEFGYCPLVWMLHSRKLNSRVNKLHERALRIVYQDYASSFTELCEKKPKEKNWFKKKTEFKRNNFKTVYNGTETLTFLGPRFSDIVPNYI